MRAHPRPCGEHNDGVLRYVHHQGSSPPVRGALAPARQGRCRSGLIPARAGSTRIRGLPDPAPRAHPRPCGEHERGVCQKRLGVGSSPPVRGALQLQAWGQWPTGLIPARAGSTAVVRHELGAIRAHPRPCGEHTGLRYVRVAVRGSSPPVRGAHLLTWGFIPYTGKIGLLWSQSLRPEYTINNCS